MNIREKFLEQINEGRKSGTYFANLYGDVCRAIDGEDLSGASDFLNERIEELEKELETSELTTRNVEIGQELVICGGLLTLLDLVEEQENN